MADDLMFLECILEVFIIKMNILWSFWKYSETYKTVMLHGLYYNLEVKENLQIFYIKTNKIGEFLFW